MTRKRSKTRTGRLRRAARRVKNSRVGRQMRFLYRSTKKTRRRSRRIRRRLRRHDLGLIASLVGVVTTVMLMIFVGIGSVVTIATGLVTILTGVTTFVWHKATPAEQIKVRHNVMLDVLSADGKKKNGKSRRSSTSAEPSGTFREGIGDRLLKILRGGSSGDRVRPVSGRPPCGARCQWSSAPRELCECSCQGDNHGSRRSVVSAAPETSSTAAGLTARKPRYRGPGSPRVVARRVAGRTPRRS